MTGTGPHGLWPFKAHSLNHVFTVLFTITLQTSYLCVSSSSNSDQILDAYSSYNEFSLAVSSLNSEVRNHVKRQVLEILDINSEPTNVADNKNSAADLYIQSLYRKFDVREKGRLEVDPNATKIRLLTYTGGNLVNSDIEEELSPETQKYINGSDTIVGCTNMNLTVPNSLEFELSPSTNYMFTSKTPILGAQVRIFISRINTIRSAPFDIKLVAANLKTKSESTEIRVESRVRGWITFNVTETVVNWIRSKDQGGSTKLRLTMNIDQVEQPAPQKYGIQNSRHIGREHHPFLVIYFHTKGIRTNTINSDETKKIIPTAVSDSRSYDGLLELKIHKNPQIRNRRNPKLPPQTKSNISIAKHPSNSIAKNDYHQKYCTKRSMHVHFGELKWNDWIIAPDGFEAAYCYGKCPFPLPPYLNSSNHAIIQMLGHLIFGVKVVPEPCCAPTKHLPITVLYYDDYSNVVLKEYRNMIVQSCSCL